MIEIRAGREPAEQFRHAVHAAVDHRRREVVRARDDVRDEFGFGRVRHRRFEHADDGRARAGSPAVELRVLPRTEGSLLSDVGPEAIGEDRGAGGLRAVVVRVEQAAEDWLQAHDLEVRAADDAGADHARFAEADHA